MCMDLDFVAISEILGAFLILVIVIAITKTICNCLSPKNKSIKIRTAQDVKTSDDFEAIRKHCSTLCLQCGEHCCPKILKDNQN